MNFIFNNLTKLLFSTGKQKELYNEVRIYDTYCQCKKTMGGLYSANPCEMTNEDAVGCEFIIMSLNTELYKLMITKFEEV